MKLLFDCHLDETPFFIDLMKYVQRAFHIETAAVTLGRRRVNDLRANGITTYNVSEFLDTHREVIREAMEQLHQCECYRAGDFHLNSAIHAERYKDAIPRQRHMEVLIGSLLFWEEMFSQYDYFIGPGMAFTLHFTAYLASMKKFNDSRYLAILTARNPNGRVALCWNHVDRWEAVRRKYEVLLAGEMAPEQRELAKAFIREFRDKHTRPEYMQLKYQTPRIRKDQIAEVFRRLRGYYVHGWKKDPYDYYTHSPFFYIRKYLGRWVKSHLDSTYFRRLPARPQCDNRYLYYPLHFQPEASTLVLAPHYVDQINFLSTVSLSLPMGTKLVVKEHPSSVGYRPRGYYDAIRKIPNVTLVPPEMDSQNLIKKALAVIVLSGTVGWEALLHKVPVISFGHAFYNDSDLTYPCNHYRELPGLIDSIMKSKRGAADEYDTRLEKFVAAVHEGTYPGFFTVPKFDERVMARQNVQNIAEAIMTEIVQKRAPVGQEAEPVWSS